MVRTIPPKPQIGNNAARHTETVKKLRVAAYVRVSTENEEQQTSFEAQYEHYYDYITNHPAWEFAGIYADDGISAVSTKYREQFNKMIQDCMDGKIDYVVTKSISRFARNTVDCLNFVRKLKDKNIPVFFEKEGIESTDQRGEIMLTILASLAQQESESLSQNVKIGMQYRFQQGKVMVNCACFLGYDKDADGKLVINPEQAETVKRIFREYLEGASCIKIAKGLERDGMLTGRGKTRWYDSTVKKILENEKYMGDALLQKTYTTDFLQKKRVKNTGIMPQYYVDDNHPAIIPKELFLAVQEEMARRGSVEDCKGRKRSFSANHCFTRLIVCGECGDQFNRIHWNNRGKKSIVWRCATRLGKKGECNARTVNEEALKDAFVAALNQILAGKQEFLLQLKKNIECVLTGGNSESTAEIDAKLADLERQLVAKAEEHEDYTDIASEIYALRKQRDELTMSENARNDYLKRIEELESFIDEQPTKINNFEESLVKRMLKRATVYEDRIIFEFHSGVNVEVNM